MVRKLSVVVAVAVWIAGAGYGFGLLVRHENAPGDPANAPQAWPVASSIARRADRATLLMMVHPQCPCSVASISELAVLMAHAQNRVDAHVLFYKPAGVAKEWAQNDLWRDASRIPGVSVALDETAAEAKRFGARTSGQVLVYDRAGELIFKGGITPSRGHAGDNAGRSAILAALADGKAAASPAFVFGCSLLDSRDRP